MSIEFGAPKKTHPWLHLNDVLNNSTRFIDNFSGGNRGSASAEYFLKSGYAVIFLFRLKTLKPFERHFQNVNVFEMVVESGNGDLVVADDYKKLFSAQMEAYRQSKARLFFGSTILPLSI